jgi:hypothetical protein
MEKGQGSRTMQAHPSQGRSPISPMSFFSISPVAAIGSCPLPGCQLGGPFGIHATALIVHDNSDIQGADHGGGLI